MKDRVSINLKDGIADVRLIRADKMNALDPAMFEGILAAGEQLRGMKGLRCVVLSGEGKAFCAGLDMASFAAMKSQGDGASVVRDLPKRTHGIANRPQQCAWQWRTLPVPVIAAVHGVALGGGFQIMLGADMRYATADARFSVMEIKWGLVPDMAGCVLLTELVRPDVVRELTFTGRTVTGTEALTLGLATRVSSDPLEDARALAALIASRSPDAIRAGKRLLHRASPVDAARVLMAESREQQRLIGSPNQREAARAGLEKREPRFVD